MAGSRRLGEVLVEMGYVDPRAVQAALEEQRRSPRRLGKILLEMGLLSEERLVRGLSLQLGIDICDPIAGPVGGNARALLPAEIALRCRVVPMSLRRDEGGQTLIVATADPHDRAATDHLRMHVGPSTRIRWMLASEGDIELALNRHYGGGGSGDARAAPKHGPPPSSPVFQAPQTSSPPAPRYAPAAVITGVPISGPRPSSPPAEEDAFEVVSLASSMRELDVRGRAPSSPPGRSTTPVGAAPRGDAAYHPSTDLSSPTTSSNLPPSFLPSSELPVDPVRAPYATRDLVLPTNAAGTGPLPKVTGTADLAPPRGLLPPVRPPVPRPHNGRAPSNISMPPSTGLAAPAPPAVSARPMPSSASATLALGGPPTVAVVTAPATSTSNAMGIAPPQMVAPPPQMVVASPPVVVAPPQMSVAPPQPSVAPPQANVAPPQASVAPPQANVASPAPVAPLSSAPVAPLSSAPVAPLSSAPVAPPSLAPVAPPSSSDTLYPEQDADSQTPILTLDEVVESSPHPGMSVTDGLSGLEVRPKAAPRDAPPPEQIRLPDVPAMVIAEQDRTPEPVEVHGPGVRRGGAAATADALLSPPLPSSSWGDLVGSLSGSLDLLPDPASGDLDIPIDEGPMIDGYSGDLPRLVVSRTGDLTRAREASATGDLARGRAVSSATGDLARGRAVSSATGDLARAREPSTSPHDGPRRPDAPAPEAARPQLSTAEPGSVFGGPGASSPAEGTGSFAPVRSEPALEATRSEPLPEATRSEPPTEATRSEPPTEATRSEPPTEATRSDPALEAPPEPPPRLERPREPRPVGFEPEQEADPMDEASVLLLDALREAEPTAGELPREAPQLEVAGHAGSFGPAGAERPTAMDSSQLRVILERALGGEVLDGPSATLLVRLFAAVLANEGLLDEPRLERALARLVRT